MTNTEKLAMLKLITAIQKVTEPVKFILSLPPTDYETTMAAVDRERDKRNAALQAAIKEAERLINEE